MLLRNIFILSTLAVAALLSPAVTSDAAAQRGGRGGGGGGGHGGGGHGGYGGGGYHGGYGGYGGYHGGYGGYGYGHGYYGGWGYPGIGIYRGYGLNRGYYGSGSYGSSGYYVYPDSGYGEIYDGSDMSQSGYYAPPAPDNTARIRVHVPEDAKVWVAGEATKQTGSERMFGSPTLTPGKTYTYDIKASWMEDGKRVEKTQKVRIRANETSNVTFGE